MAAVKGVSASAGREQLLKRNGNYTSIFLTWQNDVDLRAITKKNLLIV
jgi:hypothetical protein